MSEMVTVHLGTCIESALIHGWSRHGGTGVVYDRAVQVPREELERWERADREYWAVQEEIQRLAEGGAQ